VTLSRRFALKAAFFTEQCASPSLFSRFKITRGDPNRPLKNYGFLYDAIFSSHVRMRTNYLAMKCNLLRKIAKLEVLLVFGECLKKAWSGQ